MKFTKDIAAEILTGLLVTKTFEQYAEEPAKGDGDYQEMVDEIADLVEKHGANLVSALAEYIANLSEDVRAHELKDFLDDHFWCSGGSVGAALQQYAQVSAVGKLPELWQALDRAGANDQFNWEDYATSGASTLRNLHLIKVPATGNDDYCFVFAG